MIDMSNVSAKCDQQHTCSTQVRVPTGLLEAAPMTDEPLLEAQRNDPRVQSGPRIEVPEGIGQRVV
jgi:hypothetical protein